MEDPILALIQQITAADSRELEEYGRIHIDQFRRECGVILGWREKDEAYLRRTDPRTPKELVADLNRERDERLREARGRLRERLTNLLSWARATGRL